MEASTGPPRLPTPPTQPNTEILKQKLLRKGVYPTPKIIHTLRKKQLQKSLRKSKRHQSQSQSQSHSQPLAQSQAQSIAEEAHFQTLKTEYRNFTKAFDSTTEGKNGVPMIGKPWERLERVGLRELASASKEHAAHKLKSEHLRELSEILEKERDQFRWLLDDDIELEEGWLEKERRSQAPLKRRRDEGEEIRFLVDKLSDTNLNVRDWKFSKMMKQCGLQFTEGQLLKIVGGLGDKGQWKHAISVVEWVYNLKEHTHYKSRFVYTKLLAVLGKARRPLEAIQIFDLMRGDCQIYPDMAAYHSIAVTLGQAGLLKELMNIIECMKQKPSRKLKNMRHKNWDPVLLPDVVVFNAILNACVPSHQWKGVSWVFEQLRKSGLRPNGATHGLAMEVMLQSGKYDLVHEFFGKMRRSGEAPKARTYKVLVKAFWEEGKVNEAVRAVRDMEQRGVVGTASVYYELACCLCNNGRWQEAMEEVEKLKKLPLTKPLEVTFTGMIMSSRDGGHVSDCISIFEHIKDQFAPNVGIINAMLKIYGRNDMFSKAKELFEVLKRYISVSNTCLNGCGSSLSPDAYTYNTMLEACTIAHQWEYFEYVYKEMALSGHQLDQSKNATLLVEASRAGKWHLLEHAFDTMLEAGEIPPPLFFTELLCQAAVRHDYERVISMVGAMAHAPFQVSEKQWRDIFEKNGDRIGSDSLKKLLEALCSSDLSKEATVSNLLKSLLSLCSSDNLKGISSSVTSGDSSVDESSLNVDDGRLHCDGRANAQSVSANILSPCNNLYADGETSDTFYDGQTSNGREDDSDSEMTSRFSNYVCDGNGKSSLFTNLEDLADDLASDGSADCCDDRLSNHVEDGRFDDVGEEEHDNPTNSDTQEFDLPSAHEILGTWKESRRKDGVFFPIRYSGKLT
ncbi:pentatricopeptide repeat-containing protein At5g67570, chloroplastic [Cornus florida]|uniref:pentatricopeptide repeat-containing protein At5g67570, chloroplastic n=1 Tax=Cornus florida TaxID=4283 RepID=UPI00289F27FF|nr:pentatricopeptide repeat-containing protein At5g67570, chloroplastic [Cornus florida]